MYQSLYIISILIILAEVYIINMMVRNGNILRSKYYRYIFITLAILITGALFKILNLPLADQLILLSTSAVAFIYILWTFSKKPFYLLDALKCVWVITATVVGVVRFLHLSFIEFFLPANFLVFVLMTFVYFKYPHQRHTGAMKERQDDDTPIDQV